MPDFLFKVLGANSATPTPGRFPSSFVLQYDRYRFLLDCGEGAQVKMSQFKIKRSRIDHIFISHLHGDHIFGLPGLINSFGLDGREKPLTIYGPIGIARYLNVVLSVSGARASFELKINELDGNEYHELHNIDGLMVKAFPLKHRIPTLGYRFTEVPRLPNIKSEAIHTYGLTTEEIKSIKKGIGVQRDGRNIPLDQLTLPARPVRSFAYCTDTIYDPDLVRSIEQVDLLYHEATYLNDLADQARARMHSTVTEAATIAKMAQVSQLVIGHYSSRYKNLQPLVDEAQDIFHNTEVAEEGKVFAIG